MTLDLVLSVTSKGWKESIGFSDAERYAKSFEKKKIKKIKYLEARQAVNRELFFIISKKDQKKIFLSLITCELVSATIALFR